MNKKYIVNNLFVHMRVDHAIRNMSRYAISCISFIDAKSIFDDILVDSIAESRCWLNENSVYNTCYVSEFNNQIRLGHKVYFLKDDCKINRRKIYIRPFDEEKYSTQLEDSKVYWSEFWKER